MQQESHLNQKSGPEASRQEHRQKTYICIDLKTFYASVECIDRGRDPFTTNLVVADPDRSHTTICLAITPAMKKLGIRNRCRIFEIPPGVNYIMAKPRMRHYMEVSAQIYGIYLEYVSPEDIHAYSVDECFIDATPYLKLYRQTAREFAKTLMAAVRSRTGIYATAGIGPNLFLAKVALDITAKHVDDGIGELDQDEFRRSIWRHRPITDIWGIGPGIAARLAKYHVEDLMGVAALDADILYREFGVNAEYLIDHAHGIEPCTIAQIHAYRPQATSLMNGQVLSRDYSFAEARTVMREMVDASVLDLVERKVVCDQISLYVGYGRAEAPNENVPAVCIDPKKHSALDDTVMIGAGRAGSRGGAPFRKGQPPREELLYRGEHGTRPAAGYGAFEHGGGQRKLGEKTNSFRNLMPCFERLFDQTIDPTRAVRRVNIGFGNLLPEEFATYNLFTDFEAEAQERSLQEAVLNVKQRYGKNALLKGTSFKQGATGRERNEQVGGHHA